MKQKIHNKEFETFIKRVPDDTFDFAIDDPPYEINHMNKQDYSDKKQLNWTNISIERFRTLKENGNWGIWCAHDNVISILLEILYYNSSLPYDGILQLMRRHSLSDIFEKYCDWKLRNWIIWDRQKGRGAKHNVVSTREDFLWLAKSSKSTFNRLESTTVKKTKGMGTKNGRLHRIVSNVWSDISPICPTQEQYKIVAKVNDNKMYKGQKPVELISRCINMLSSPGDLGNDGFCGSGTFAVACIKNDRQYIINDVNKKAIDIAKMRIRKII